MKSHSICYRIDESYPQFGQTLARKYSAEFRRLRRLNDSHLRKTVCGAFRKSKKKLKKNKVKRKHEKKNKVKGTKEISKDNQIENTDEIDLQSAVTDSFEMYPTLMDIDTDLSRTLCQHDKNEDPKSGRFDDNFINVVHYYWPANEHLQGDGKVNDHEKYLEKLSIKCHKDDTVKSNMNYYLPVKKVSRKQKYENIEKKSPPAEQQIQLSAHELKSESFYKREETEEELTKERLFETLLMAKNVLKKRLNNIEKEKAAEIAKSIRLEQEMHQAQDIALILSKQINVLKKIHFDLEKASSELEEDHIDVNMMSQRLELSSSSAEKLFTSLKETLRKERMPIEK